MSKVSLILESLNNKDISIKEIKSIRDEVRGILYDLYSRHIDDTERFRETGRVVKSVIQKSIIDGSLYIFEITSKGHFIAYDNKHRELVGYTNGSDDKHCANLFIRKVYDIDI